MAPPATDKKAEKATLLDSINPWSGSRTASPARGPEAVASTAATSTTSKTGKATTALPDHSISPYYGRSIKQYPPDCPPLKVQWFHAVDVPKRQGHWMNGKNFTKSTKPTAPAQPPKKFVPFSINDNKSIEAAYQKTLESFEDGTRPRPKMRSTSGSKPAAVSSSGDLGEPTLGSGEEPPSPKTGTKVPVNEDFLFDVDIEERELAPVYWLGPVYDVRRGSWFYQEGSTLRPCEENLASQLEEGYLKAKPWLYPAPEKSTLNDLASKKSTENLKAPAPAPGSSKRDSSGMRTLDPAPSSMPTHQPETHRLFGQYMNHVATYQDASTAWLSTDGMLSWVASSMYERFSGGAYMSGVKVVRGYSEAKKAKDDKRAATPTGSKSSVDEAEEKRLRALKRRSAPASIKADVSDSDSREGRSATKASRRSKEDTSAHSGRPSTTLQRQLSSLIGSSDNLDPEAQAEEIRKREEQEIRDDYNANSGEKQGREIEHLVLITHGIGQLLGLRVESLNFIHDVNVFRKTLKSVYAASPGLRALNSELPEGTGNCRIQVLPVCWRHLLDFPRRSSAQKPEQDLGDIKEEEDEYPSLEDITVDGMAFARSLISDLALDVLLYQSAYREQILEIVRNEANRIYKLYRERNPEFNGTVHVIGHSLGSAIMFDLLCGQKENPTPEEQRNPLRFWPSSPDAARPGSSANDLSFDFDVEDFYCLGSPIGLFQMLKGRTIAARQLVQKSQGAAGTAENPIDVEYADDTFLSAPSMNAADQRVSQITGLPFSVSSPKAAQLFNIFHPSDPIGYRLEPLIAPAMSTLKPQPLPYTKKGLFGSVAPQGLTGIGAKVGQSVSGLWSSFSAGIASNLLNRSLGLSQEDVAKLEQQQQQQQAQGTAGEGKPRAESEGDIPTVVVDDEPETLFSHFQKKRADIAKEEAKAGHEKSYRDRKEEEAKAQKMRREEAKVRALNRNGRVDYHIQEGVLDFNPINTIASHLSYWADEDVSHFIMSQLLTGKPKQPKKN